MIHSVLCQNIALLRKYDGYQTSDGTLMRVKMSLSVGKTNIHIIGDETRRIFSVTGSCINDVRMAQSVVKPGTIVIPYSAWKMCDQSQFVSREIGIGFFQVHWIY